MLTRDDLFRGLRIRHVKLVLLLPWLMSLSSLSCSDAPLTETQLPPSPAAEAQNLDSSKLAELVNRIEQGDFGAIHSLLIYRNGGPAFDMLREYIFPAVEDK